MAKWQSQDSNPSPVHCYPGPCSVLAHMQLSCVEHHNHLESLVTHPLPCMEAAKRGESPHSKHRGGQPESSRKKRWKELRSQATGPLGHKP